MLEGWLIGITFVLGAIAIGYLPAQVLRRRFGPVQPADTRALSSEMMARIGALHGLILALVFANAQGNAAALRADVHNEATAIGNVYYNAKRYGSVEVQVAAVAYLRAVVDKDWPSLRAHHQLSLEGWRAWRDALDASMDLEPSTRREALLAAQIDGDLWKIEALRQARNYEANNKLPTEFWLLAISGLVLISLLLFVHEINPLHQGMMACYSVYTGLALFLIYDLSHPFTGLVQLMPDDFANSLQVIASGL